MNATLISQDDFYVGRKAMLLAGESGQNFDTLSAIDCEHLSLILKNAQMPCVSTIQVPNYDFVQQAPLGFKSIEVKSVLVAEGHLIFTSPNVLDQLGFLIYMDADRDVAKERRFSRDLLQRGYDISSSRSYYEKYVVPQLDAIDKLRSQADYIVNSNDRVDSFRPEVAIIADILKGKIGNI